MDLSYSGEHAAFHDEVRAFLGENWRPETKPPKPDYVTAFRARATERGYLYRSIARKYGGSEQAPDVMKAHILREEFGRAGAPMEVPGNGVNLVVPTLLDCAEEWQKQEFIPKTLTGEYVWSQGYSEPGAGSDLASLRTKAELVGDEWVITGQKIWTTFAHKATHFYMLVRTEPDIPKHGGISYLLVPAKQPGIEVRRIKQINGGAEFNEVFFDGARTPANWIVGKRGDGWHVSKSTLKHERNHVGSATRTVPMFNRLVKMAKRRQVDGRPAIENPLIRERLAVIEGHVQAQVWAGFHQLTLAARGEGAGVLGLTNKMNSAVINFEIAKAATDILDACSLLAPAQAEEGGGDERWVRQILGSLAVAIAGGTSNIQRNIIAERGFGLPRDSTAATPATQGD